MDRLVRLEQLGAGPDLPRPSKPPGCRSRRCRRRTWRSCGACYEAFNRATEASVALGYFDPEVVMDASRRVDGRIGHGREEMTAIARGVG